MKKLVILVSTFNGEKYLRVQIDSLLNQTIAADTTIIVRDDGSSDETLEILEQYEKDGKIILRQGKNKGVVLSFFDLLEQAPEAEYYAFCDQDDYWLPEKMEVAIGKLESISKPALYCSRKTLVDEDLKELSREDTKPLFNPLDVLMKRNIASGCTMVFNQSLRKLFLKYPSDKTLYHDTWLFNLAYFTGKVIYDDNSYILYRQHGNNVVGAIPQGWQFFLYRLRHIDFTLDKYRRRNKATVYANILNHWFSEDILPEYKDLIENVACARKSMRARSVLFSMGGLSTKPLYEFLIYKIYLLLGWL